MSRARISVNGVDGTAFSVPIGTPVLMSNDGDGGESSYAWSIVDQPPGTTDALSNPAIQNPNFTPTKEGTYLLKLVVDASLGSEATQTCTVYIVDARTGERLPAAAETVETGVRGWAGGQGGINVRALRAYADPSIYAAVTPGGIAAGVIVNLVNDMATVNAGTQATADIPKITVATGAEGHAHGLLGVLLDGVTPGVLTAGKVVLVRVFGIVAGAVAGTTSVRSPVYLSDAGAPSLTPGTYPRVIGRVVAYDGTGHLYRWVIDGRDATFFVQRRLTTPAEIYVKAAGSDWTRDGEDGSGPWCWHTATATGAPLVIPLKINPGEVIERIDLRVYQDDATKLLNGQLFIGGDVAGGGANTGSSALTSPATAGDFVWSPALATGPVQIAAHERAWLEIETDATAGLRRVLGVTTFARAASD